MLQDNEEQDSEENDTENEWISYISDFDMESANTVFADGIVLCMVAGACGPSVFPETLAEALSSINEVNSSAVCALLTSKNALASDCDASADVMLVNIK